MLGQNLTKGNVTRELWSLAWPLMLSVFMYTLYNIIDAFWVSKISGEAIAAVSISQVVIFIMVALSMGLAIGSGVITAMHIGAGHKKEAERVLGQSFVLSAIAAALFTVFSLIFRNQLLIISGAQGSIFEPALEYFTITAAGSVLLFILMNTIFAFNFQGDTLSLTKLLFISIIVNVILDPVLIFGLFGFPVMGIAGAAIATLISQAIFIAIAIRSLMDKNRKIRFHFYNLSIKWESVKKVFSIGIPASLTQVLGPAGEAAILFILSLVFLEAGAISYSIGFRIEFFAFLPAIGFGFGAASLIGQNIGAGNLNRAQESFSTALKFSVIGSAGIGILAIIFSSFIVGIFTNDPLIKNYATSFIWIVSLGFGFFAATMVEASAFQAIGRSWPGLWISIVRLIIVTLPLSLFFTKFLNLPIQSVWIAITLGNIIASIFGYFWIKRTFANLDISKVPVHK